MNPEDVRTLENELERFKRKPCRICQLIFAMSMFIFLLSLTLFLFAQKGVPPSSVIPVQEIPRDKPLSRADEAVIVSDLRALSANRERLSSHGIEEDHERFLQKATSTRPKYMKP